MLVRELLLAAMLIAVTAAGGCAAAQRTTSAPTTPCSPTAAPSQAPDVVLPQQKERVWSEKDDNLAPIDSNAVGRQGQRLRTVGAAYPDTFGGVTLDPVAGELTVRFVNTSHRHAFLGAVNGLPPHRGDVPVKFAEVDQSFAAMKALAAELDNSRDWAGAAAPCIHEVYFNELNFQLSIDAWGAEDQQREAVRTRTGLTAEISSSPYGIVPQ